MLELITIIKELSNPTPETIVEAIRFMEKEMGESYLERYDIFSDTTELMEFALEKGYITKEKYNLWKKDFMDNEIGTEENFEVIFGEDPEYDIYCITLYDKNSEETFDEQYEKALLVYGELICSSDRYKTAFVKEFKMAII